MIIEIPKDELLESLKEGYLEYAKCKRKGHNAIDLAHIKGYCVTIEQILNTYGNVLEEDILNIKKPILGEESLYRQPNTNIGSDDYDIPTIFRKF